MSYAKPAVSAVIFNSDGQVLLVRCSAKAPTPGQWILPGGLLQGGHDWQTSLKEEVEARVGLSVTGQRLIGIYSAPEAMAASFLVNAFEGEVALDEQSDQFEWYSPDSLPNPVPKPEATKIQDALNFKGKVFVR